MHVIKDHYDFSLASRRFVDAHGELINPLPDWANTPELLHRAYRAMALLRVFDSKAIALQRTGQLGTYASVLGHEAIGAAIGLSLRDDDVLAPYYRDHVAQTLRGVKLEDILLYWGGDERGSAWENCRQDLPICVPIATQCSHAAGIASAFRIRGEKRAVICTIGDGGSSKGDFLESLNVAGAWHLPVVYVLCNNQWAISTAREFQCAAEVLAQKGIGAGIPSEVVDGNDFIAINDAVRHALDRAHAGKGPTLIEAITYRLSDHTTADDASRYRSAEELKAAWEREPVKRLQTFLHHRGWWSAEQEQALQAECKEQVQEAVECYLAVPPAPATAMFEHLYASLPRAYAAQWDALRREAGGEAVS